MNTIICTISDNASLEHYPTPLSRVQNMQNAPTNLGHPLATKKCRCIMKGSQRLDFRKEKTFAR